MTLPPSRPPSLPPSMSSSSSSSIIPSISQRLKAAALALSLSPPLPRPQSQLPGADNGVGQAAASTADGSQRARQSVVESQRHLLSLRVVRPTALVAAAQAPTGGEAAPAQAPEHTPSSALPAGTSASAGVSGRASGSAAASHRRVKVRRIARGVVELTAGAGPAGAHTGTGSGAGASISTTGAWSAPGVAAANTEVRPPAVTGSGPSQGQRSTQLSSVAGSLAAPEATQRTAAAAPATTASFSSDSSTRRRQAPLESGR